MANTAKYPEPDMEKPLSNAKVNMNTFRTARTTVPTAKYFSEETPSCYNTAKLIDRQSTKASLTHLPEEPQCYHATQCLSDPSSDTVDGVRTKCR